MIDSHVIFLCRAGDPKGHQKLYQQTAAYAYSIASRYLGNKEDCRDAMQEAYAKTFSNIEQYDAAKGEFKYWFRKILVNECLRHLKRKKSFLTVESDGITTPTDQSYQSSIQLTREDIQQLLKEMPARYKLVFMLAVMDDYNHQEIAEQLNISPETSRSQLTRAKHWLRKHMNGSTKWEQYGLR